MSLPIVDKISCKKLLCHTQGKNRAVDNYFLLTQEIYSVMVTAMRDAHIIEGLVEKFGGPIFLSSHLKCDTQSVRKWRVIGRVPWKWRYALRCLAEDKGIELTDEERNILSLIPERQVS